MMIAMAVVVVMDAPVVLIKLSELALRMSNGPGLARVPTEVWIEPFT